MATFALPHLPVLTETDNTRNWEALAFFLRNGVGGVPGAWVNPEGFSAKTENHATLQVRKEDAGNTARLKGFLQAKEAIPVETTLFTLPAGYRPPATVKPPSVEVNTSALLQTEILTSGVVQNRVELKITRFLSFDSCTFQLPETGGEGTSGGTGTVALPHATVPAKAPNGETRAGEIGIGRTVFANLTGDGAKKEFTITHNLNSYFLIIEIQKDEAGRPGLTVDQNSLFGLPTATSLNEITIKYEGVLGAGTTYWLTITSS